MGPRHAYLVCATPRSGSTLLCELLKATGVAGVPEEYFEATAATGAPPHPGDYLAGLHRTGAGIRDDLSPPEAPAYSSLNGLPDYRAHLERTWRLGTTPNGVFASKLMWHQVGELHRLATQLPEFAGLEQHALLDALFGGPVYVWISRRDKVRQAVSMWRALQSRSWRQGGGRGAAPLHYRFDGIDHLVTTLERHDAGWKAFFRDGGIDVLAISYEDDLERDRRGTIAAVLRRVGHEPPAGWYPGDPLVRQSDALSEEWVERYRRERAAVAPAVS